MRQSLVLGFLSVLLLSIGALEASAQDRMSLRIKPAFATNDAIDVIAPGLDFQVHIEQIPCRECNVERTGSIDLKGRLLTRPSLNSVPLVAEAQGGGVINFYEPPVYVRDARDPDARRVLRSKDYGRLHLTAHGRFQGTQDLLDSDLLGGVALGYTNLRTTGLFGWVPSVAVSGQFVVPIKSDDRESVGHNGEPFGRVRGVASVHPPVGELIGLDRLVGHLSLEASADIGTTDDWNETEFDRSHYFEGSLGYLINRPEWYLFEVFAGVAYGRIPPEIQEETIWRIGLVMGR